MRRLLAPLLLAACASTPDPSPLPPAPVTAEEMDADRSGDLESADRCVAEPETRNGLDDGDGCPDAIPAELAAALAPYRWQLREIDELTRGRVGPRVRRALQRVADAMRAHPNIAVEIRFHRDGAWAPDSPAPCGGGECLSTLTHYLVEREGIALERLATSLVGPDEPLDSNDTPAGRARNRRFEFELLVR